MRDGRKIVSLVEGSGSLCDSTTRELDLVLHDSHPMWVG